MPVNLNQFNLTLIDQLNRNHLVIKKMTNILTDQIDQLSSQIEFNPQPNYEFNRRQAAIKVVTDNGQYLKAWGRFLNPKLQAFWQSQINQYLNESFFNDVYQILKVNPNHHFNDQLSQIKWRHLNFNQLNQKFTNPVINRYLMLSLKLEQTLIQQLKR